MQIAEVKCYTLKEISPAALEGYRSGAHFKDLRNDPLVCNNWLTFTAVGWNSIEGCLYTGLTAYDTDVF